MALSSTQDKLDVWGDYMQDDVRLGELGDLDKHELKAFLDAMDGAVDNLIGDKSVDLKTAMPDPGKTVLTPQQKTLALLYITQKRIEKGL